MIRGIVIEEGGEEERLGHVIGHVVGEQRVLDTGDEALAEDDVRGLDVAHPHQRQGPVEVVHLGGVLRAQAAVLPQRGGLEVGALPRHGPRIPHAAHVRERLRVPFPPERGAVRVRNDKDAERSGPVGVRVGRTRTCLTTMAPASDCTM